MQYRFGRKINMPFYSLGIVHEHTLEVGCLSFRSPCNFTFNTRWTQTSQIAKLPQSRLKVLAMHQHLAKPKALLFEVFSYCLNLFSVWYFTRATMYTIEGFSLQCMINVWITWTTLDLYIFIHLAPCSWYHCQQILILQRSIIRRHG